MENVDLNDIIKYASKHVEYYRNSFKDIKDGIEDIRETADLAKLPVLDKDALQSDHDIFVSDEYQCYPKMENICVKDIIGYDGKIFKMYSDIKTSGESDKIVDKLRKNFYGVDKNNKLCTFYQFQFIGNKLRNVDECHDERSKNKLEIFVHGMTKERFRKICSEIRDFAPEWMIVKPSIAAYIADIMESENIAPFEGLEYIELKGEAVSSEQRKRIEKSLGARTVSAYSYDETGYVAYEYPDGKMHILSDVAAIEAVNEKAGENGEEGEIYITSLNEHSMPVIRYATGDRGVVTVNSSGESIIDIIPSKDISSVVLENGEIMPADYLAMVMELTSNSMSRSIKQFHIIQNDINRFTVEMVVHPSFGGWKKSIEESFISNIDEPQLKKAEWNFIWKDEITSDHDKRFYINCIGA